MSDAPASSSNGRPKILVADDSLVVRSLLRRQLEEHDYVVIEAVDGEDAVIRTRAESPDVILLDVEMPRLDGYTALTRIRELHQGADVPVVFLTARATTEEIVNGLRLGAHDYLTKPFEPAELVARVSAAVRVKRLQDELRARNADLEELSRMDVLTGLPNRRHLQEHLYAASAAARRLQQPFAVVMVDVDHFKKINDEHGHQMGDEVLKSIASRVESACRGEDVAGRWGGEEFLVVAPGTDLSQAVVLGERLRSLVADRDVWISADLAIPVTVSAGVASGTDAVDALLRAADEAMYRAKDAGRNCVASAGDT
jgi:diguanylate cyclase (GGDEF)-like protein